MTVRAGRLRHRLRVLKLLGERDEFGSVVGVKETVGTFWCDAEEVDNYEEGDTLVRGQTKIKFTTRYNQQLEDPDPSMYISFRGKEWDIIGVNNYRMLNEWLSITAIQRG